MVTGRQAMRCQRAIRGIGFIGVIASSLMLGACAQMGGTPGNLAGLSGPRETPAAKPTTPQNELERATEHWGKEFAKYPTNAKVAINYARNLKALGYKQQALAVLQQAATFNGNDRELAGEYGRLALEFGQHSVAERLLALADDPTRPDWRILSARGAVLGKTGRHKQALPFFERAAAIAPDKPTVLNNLAMAYVADGQPEKAEPLLRRAIAMPGGPARIRQNLALVLGLQGRYDEAKTVASMDLAPQRAEESVAQIRQMVQLPPKSAPTGLPAPSTALAAAPRPPLRGSAKPVATAAKPSPWGATVARADQPIVLAPPR